MAIDYGRAKKEFTKQKAALTRATKKADTLERYRAVLAACTSAVREWEAIGSWPDSWSRWQRALEDATVQHHHATGVFLNAPRLESLSL